MTTLRFELPSQRQKVSRLQTESPERPARLRHCFQVSHPKYFKIFERLYSTKELLRFHQSGEKIVKTFRWGHWLNLCTPASAEVASSILVNAGFLNLYSGVRSGKRENVSKENSTIGSRVVRVLNLHRDKNS